MVMGLVLLARVVKVAGRLLLARLPDAERAGHAQMHQQHVARGEIGQEVFGPPAEPGHGLALQAGGKILLKRKSQVPAAGFGLDDLGALHHRLQAAADGLDFGPFGPFSRSPYADDVIPPSRRARYGPGTITSTCHCGRSKATKSAVVDVIPEAMPPVRARRGRMTGSASNPEISRSRVWCKTHHPE